MIRPAILATAFVTALAAGTSAQGPQPFDMSPESDLRTAPPEPVVSAPATPQTPALPAVYDRHLLPEKAVRLSGEEDGYAAAFYLTSAQAGAATTLSLSYINSVVVAPEVSRLNVRINGSEVATNVIGSSSARKRLSLAIPGGLLREGANTLELQASQRHRTDCTVGSTFELWTEIDGAGTALSFQGPGFATIGSLAELAAVGTDADGRTTVRLDAPGLASPEAKSVAIDAAQRLALSMRVPDLRFETASAPREFSAPGVLDVVLAPSNQLADDMARYSAQAAAGPIAAVVPGTSGSNTLLISGPDWRAVGLAAEAVTAAAPVSGARPRIDLPFAVPLIEGAAAISLSDLGVTSTEFNGRRFTTRFRFELPPDFYAAMYGEAELVLDAAYSSDVLPGSEIDIYANGSIASATPLLRTDGGTLRDTVIRFPMTNLRPGRNEMQIVVNLNTRSDESCVPGWTGEAPVRFVFSSSSQLRLPDFARASSLPDLETFTGSAWPYTEGDEVEVAVGSGPDDLLAAMTLFGRTATASATVLPVVPVDQDLLDAGRNAIVVASAADLSRSVADRVGLAPALGIQTSTGDADLLNRFNVGTNSDGVRGFADWMLSGVGLELEDLRVLPRTDGPVAVPAGAVALAQARLAEGGVWTVLSGDAVLEGIRRLAVTDQWRKIGGRVTTLSQDGTTVTVPTVAPVLVQTSAFSLANFRLIAANWFSGNILLFTMVLGAAATLLMLTTAAMLSRIGRQR